MAEFGVVDLCFRSFEDSVCAPFNLAGIQSDEEDVTHSSGNRGGRDHGVDDVLEYWAHYSRTVKSAKNVVRWTSEGRRVEA